MRNSIKLTCCTLIVLSMLLFATFATDTASAKSVNSAQGSSTLTSRHVSLLLTSQSSTPQALKTVTPHEIKPQGVKPADSQDFGCRIINIQGTAGNVCIVIFLDGAGIPYAVDIHFDQRLIDTLATSGAAASTAVASAIAVWLPALGPYTGVIAAVLAFVAVSLDNYARTTCGSQGVGIYISTLGEYYYHC